MQLNAHACGIWHGWNYTNCAEAFDAAIKIGFKFIEVDVSITKDGVFVCGHDDERISEVQSDLFLGDRRAWNGSPMSLADLMDRTNKLRGMRILLDYHPGWEMDRPEELRRLALILLQAKDQDKYLLEVYSQADASAVLSVSFTNIVMWIGNRRRRHHPIRQVVSENVSFCLNRGIKAVSLSRKEALAVCSELQRLKTAEILIFSCGWNTLRSLRKAETIGIDIATTMNLIPGGRWKNMAWATIQRLYVIRRILAEKCRSVFHANTQPRGRRVFLVGVFDMLHYGHFELFRRAKALAHGGRLTVAVQDDDYVLKYKPDARIVVPLRRRIEMISSLRYVDWVDIYTDVDEIVQEVDFDVFVVGEDQRHAGFQRAIDWCKANGREVVRLSRTPGVSSTELRKSISDLQ